jgi:hypothetical protein
MDWQHTSLGSWLRKRDVQRPLFPAHVLLGTPKEVSLLPLLLEELYYELTSASLLVGPFYGPDQRYGSLLDERLEVDIVNGGEGQIEQVASERRYRGEVSVEEYGMEYC